MYDHDFQRSHSSSLNSSSYLSLYSRKLSLAKSSNTLFERLEKIFKIFKSLIIFVRFGSINEDTEDVCNNKSRHQVISKQKSFDESSLSSAQHHSDSPQLLTTSAEVNFNNLTMPSSALSRKPSITFNETVFVFRSERRNSSPGMNFFQ